MKESGMIFEFAENNCYRIEDDPLVKKSNCASTLNNKGCECVSFIDGHHCFIEAKSSALEIGAAIFPLPSGKTVDKQSLVNLQEALKNEMRPFLNVWKIPDTSIKIVLPEDAAKILHIPASM